MKKIILTIIFTSFLTTLVYADDETYPTPPKPDMNSSEVRTKAGFGSEVSYAEAGVLELGGSLGFVTANDFTQVSISPSLGWFITDNFELTGILSYNNVKQKNDSAAYWTLLAEPSFHYPFNKTTFGFVGLGLGVAHSNDVGTGLALQPRIGANILIGRSGILTPSVFTAYNAIKSQSIGGGVNSLAVDTLSGVNVSYTIIW